MTDEQVIQAALLAAVILESRKAEPDELKASAIAARVIQKNYIDPLEKRLKEMVVY